MDRLEAVFASLARERKERKGNPSAEKARQLTERLFAEQRALVLDPATRKALLCPSRAGKSYAYAVYILRTLLLQPRANVLYIAFIRSQAKEILWNLLKALDEEFQLGFHFSEADLTVTTTGGGYARLAGCESWGDVDKFRGIPRHLVILDEAAIWHAQLLEDLILQVIEPRLGDYRGTLVMGGTPGDVLAGPFYEATGPAAVLAESLDDGTPRAAARPFAERELARWQGIVWTWSLHGWPKNANTSPEGQNAWAEALELKRRNGWSDDNPIWVREHLGRWMADDSKLVFRYEPGRNAWRPGKRTPENPFGLPDGHYWRFVIACDLGAADPFSLQVGAFSDTHPDLFQVYEYEYDPRLHNGKPITVDGIARAVRTVLELIEEPDVESMVADLQGLGKMLVESLGQQHGIWFERLEQRDKRDHIELTNSGLVDRRIWILEGSLLGDEMLYLAWDPTGLKTRPDQRNDNCDAFLGVVRHSRHLEAAPAPVVPRRGTPEWIEAEERKDEERVATRARRRRRGDGDLDDDGSPDDSTEWME